jgi:hypothetical protein
MKRLYVLTVRELAPPVLRDGREKVGPCILEVLLCDKMGS